MSLPALRFKEFNEDWSVKKLSDIAEKIGDGIHSTPIYDENGEYYFINGNNLNNGKIDISKKTKRVNLEEYLKHKVDLTDQTLLISINGTIGNLAFFNGEKVILGKSACYINLKRDENKYFVRNLLQTSNISNHFNKELTGSSIKNLSLSTIKNTKAFFPSHEEQDKIANFLTAIDKKIAQLARMHELLTQYKTGAMQNIFNLKLRFKDDNGKDFLEWNEVALNDLCDIQKGKQLNKSELNDFEEFPVINGGQEPSGYTNTWNTEANTITISEGGNSCGFVNLIKQKFWSGGHCYSLVNIKTGINNFFLYHALKFYEEQLKRLRIGSGLPNIQKSAISDFTFKIPMSNKEQIRIANFFDAIDEKIAATQSQLEAVKQYKQGLLQQMFV